MGVQGARIRDLAAGTGAQGARIRDLAVGTSAQKVEAGAQGVGTGIRAETGTQEPKRKNDDQNHVQDRDRGSGHAGAGVEASKFIDL